jgi:hypothetical protein
MFGQSKKQQQQTSSESNEELTKSRNTTTANNTNDGETNGNKEAETNTKTFNSYRYPVAPTRLYINDAFVDIYNKNDVNRSKRFAKMFKTFPIY